MLPCKGTPEKSDHTAIKTERSKRTARPHHDRPPIRIRVLGQPEEDIALLIFTPGKQATRVRANPIKGSVPPHLLADPFPTIVINVKTQLSSIHEVPKPSGPTRHPRLRAWSIDEKPRYMTSNTDASTSVKVNKRSIVAREFQTDSRPRLRPWRCCQLLGRLRHNSDQLIKVCVHKESLVPTSQIWQLPIRCIWHIYGLLHWARRPNFRQEPEPDRFPRSTHGAYWAVRVSPRAVRSQSRESVARRASARA